MAPDVTLAPYLNHPSLIARRREAHVLMRRSLNDHRARYRATERLSRIYSGLHSGRRWDLIARDLRDLAIAADRVPVLLLELDKAQQMQEAA